MPTEIETRADELRAAAAASETPKPVENFWLSEEWPFDAPWLDEAAEFVLAEAA